MRWHSREYSNCQREWRGQQEYELHSSLRMISKRPVKGPSIELSVEARPAVAPTISCLKFGLKLGMDMSLAIRPCPKCLCVPAVPPHAFRDCRALGVKFVRAV